MPKYRMIWYFGVLTEIGRQMELLVLGWLLLEITNSPLQFGVFFFANNLPRPVFSIFTGLIADRFDRNKILWAGALINVISGIVVFALIYVESIVPYHIFIASWINGSCRAIEDPARRTGVLDIVGERRIVNALGIDNFSQVSGKIFGPLIGGAMLSWQGFKGAYITIAVIHLITLIVSTRISIPKQVLTLTPESVAKSVTSGMKYVFTNKMILTMFYVTILMNGLAFEAFNFIPEIGKNYLFLSPFLAFFLVSSHGTGQAIGALLISFTKNINRYGLWFFIGSVSILVVIILFSWSKVYVLSIGLLFISGLGLSLFATMQSTIAMLYTPSDMRGRVMGLLSFCIGTGHLFALVIGWLAEMLGTPSALSLSAGIGLILIIPSIFVSPLGKKNYHDQIKPNQIT